LIMIRSFVIHVQSITTTLWSLYDISAVSWKLYQANEAKVLRFTFASSFSHWLRLTISGVTRVCACLRMLNDGCQCRWSG
jgi:hypothetical protein